MVTAPFREWGGPHAREDVWRQQESFNAVRDTRFARLPPSTSLWLLHVGVNRHLLPLVRSYCP